MTVVANQEVHCDASEPTIETSNKRFLEDLRRPCWSNVLQEVVVHFPDAQGQRNERKKSTL
eukprot:CAMPEP_0169167414 /NCGR_PEP_ID=MMETSP1015-20121227/60464_1 /TAXON_ID=342587 /ORGANISM="Karlodinium micrum, Strain CCMP2283" /LENGTH=60 /DNA_ID=CAMNT_0009240133 /DNA_START=94 /DNA_END=276 /DNA_ORIENTATION=-